MGQFGRLSRENWVYYHPGLNRVYPVEVTGRTPHTVAGPVAATAGLDVIPDLRWDEEVAGEFVAALQRWGFDKAELKQPGVTLEQPV